MSSTSASGITFSGSFKTGRLRIAEVARKHQLARPAFAAKRHLQPRRAKNVAGVMEADIDVFGRMNRYAVIRPA